QGHSYAQNNSNNNSQGPNFDSDQNNSSDRVNYPVEMSGSHNVIENSCDAQFPDTRKQDNMAVDKSGNNRSFNSSSTMNDTSVNSSSLLSSSIIEENNSSDGDSDGGGSDDDVENHANKVDVVLDLFSLTPSKVLK